MKRIPLYTCCARCAGHGRVPESLGAPRTVVCPSCRGKGFVPTADTILEEGDEVLAVLDPGKEDDLKALFGPEGDGGVG